MAVPKALRQKLVERLDSLISESEEILNTTEKRTRRREAAFIRREVEHTATEYEVLDALMMVTWRTKCVDVLSNVVPENSPNRNIIEEFQQHCNPEPGVVKYLVARLSAIRDDFRDGFLDDAWSMLNVEVASDYLTQAETLLDEGYHLPAAVLAGAVLEGWLRDECGRQDPPIPTVTAQGKRKTLGVLKKAGVYNEARAKEMRGWAAIRNHAAHGEFEEFSSEQVRNMLSGIESFLAQS